jgi:hypothetical protein
MQCSFHSVQLSCLAQRWCYSHLETLRRRHSSYPNNSLLSGKTVVEPPSSNIDCFHKTECFFHSHEKGNFPKGNVFTLKNLKDRQYSFQQVTYFLQGEKVQDNPPLTHGIVAEIQGFVHFI